MKLAYGALVLAFLVGCNGKEEPDKSEPKAVAKLKVIDDKVGTGDPIKNGDIVAVKYEGKLANGKVFDATKLHGNDPFTFTVGQGGVIKGWDQGILGARKGGVRRLEIPYALGYGAAGSGESIPPNSDLFFTIEVVNVTSAANQNEVPVQIIKKGTGPLTTPTSRVTLRYDVKDAKGKTVGSNKATVRLDNKNLLPAIADAVMDLPIGSTVEITLPPQFGARGLAMRYGYSMMEPTVYIVTVDPAP